MPDEMPKWRKALKLREGTLYPSRIAQYVATLPYWQQQKVLAFILEQETEEYPEDKARILEYTKREVAMLLPWVPKDDLPRILQIVRMYVGRDKKKEGELI